MVLAYFMYKMTFGNMMDRKYCYDNYMYNYVKPSQIPNFKAYNITIKLGMIYAHIIKYSDLLLFSEYQRLLAANLTKGL